MLLFVMSVLAMFGTGCGYAAEKPAPTPIQHYDVSSLFQAFYDHWGGEAVLGKAISPELTEGHNKFQWVETGKIVFDPQAPVDRRFVMAPLGRGMGVEEPAIPPPDRPELRYVGGHTIYPDFWPLYEDLGANVVGNPLTEARYNPVRRRYEQYFENLGFYRLEGHSDVHLLLYGVWSCGTECQRYLAQEGEPLNSLVDVGAIDINGEVNPVFEEMIRWLGRDFTGSDLSQAYLRDGTLEQVFENVVLVTNNIDDPMRVTLRSLPTELNVISALPLAYSGAPDMQFVAVDDDLGYEVPNYFWAYIQRHGGLEFLGAPITHLEQVDPRTYRQCFMNICLLYVPDEIESMRIRPEALGYVYRLLYPPPVSTPKPTQTPAMDVTTLKVWESFSAITSTQRQEIGAFIMSNDTPISEIVTELVLIMPDGSQEYYTMPPTDQDGHTSMLLAPIDAMNGLIIEYQVCISHSVHQQFCVRDSFMIWNNP